jgi:hypothetical protein
MPLVAAISIARAGLPSSSGSTSAFGRRPTLASRSILASGADTSSVIRGAPDQDPSHRTAQMSSSAIWAV